MSFQKLKTLLTIALILTLPVEEEGFIVYSDLDWSRLCIDVESEDVSLCFKAVEGSGEELSYL